MKGYSTVNEEKFTGSGEDKCPTNLMDKFPELNLRPSSLLREIEGDPKSYLQKRKKILLPISVIIFFLPSIIWIVSEGVIDVYEVLAFLGIGAFLCTLTILVTVAVCNNRIFFSSIKKKCDYYQDNTKNKKDEKSLPYIIVVKDNKFGVMKAGKEDPFQIHPNYDYLSWRESGKLLNAKSNGESFVIDISGARLP